MQNPKKQLNWHSAYMFCKRFNMELLTIESDEEQQNIVKFVLDSGLIGLMDHSFWMAGTDVHGRGNWTWMTTGLTLTQYTNWKPGQPDNYQSVNHCLGTAYDEFTWIDAPCDDEKTFVCEYYSG